MQFISDEVRENGRILLSCTPHFCLEAPSLTLYGTGETFKQLKSSKKYEKNLYLVSQMYEPEWTTSHTL